MTTTWPTLHPLICPPSSLLQCRDTNRSANVDLQKGELTAGHTAQDMRRTRGGKSWPVVKACFILLMTSEYPALSTKRSPLSPSLVELFGLETRKESFEVRRLAMVQPHLRSRVKTLLFET